MLLLITCECVNVLSPNMTPQTDLWKSEDRPNSPHFPKMHKIVLTRYKYTYTHRTPPACTCLCYTLNTVFVLRCVFSAGIGRTGVLITMETALTLVDEGRPVFPLDIVKTLRDQRAMMVQTTVQRHRAGIHASLVTWSFRPQQSFFLFLNSLF